MRRGWERGSILCDVIMMKNLKEYDSEEDEDYQPLMKEERQFVNDQATQGPKRHKHRRERVNVKEYWEQTKREVLSTFTPPPPQLPHTHQQMVELSRLILTSSQIRREKKVMFAGKQFILDEMSGQMREVQKMQVDPAKEGADLHSLNANEKEQLSAQYEYLNHIIHTLQQRYRNINSIHKSKMDWKKFVKKEGIEEKMSFHRKGGALEDVKFMKRTNQSS